MGQDRCPRTLPAITTYLVLLRLALLPEPRLVVPGVLKATRNRVGFTLVELLVVVTIIAMLVAMLLPALSAARSAARLLQCTNNLKQVALAMHTYHDTYSSLPVGAYSCCWGTWQAAILPYLVGPNMEGRYVGAGSYTIRYADSMNLPVTSKKYPVLLCPEDWPTKLSGVTMHNYVANFGTTGLTYTGSGNTTTVSVSSQVGTVMSHGAPFSAAGGATLAPRGVTFGEITDGLANTLMLSEVIQGHDGDLRGYTWWGFAAGFSTYLTPNSSQPDVMQESFYCVGKGVNPPCIGPYTNAMPMMQAARSRHASRGVNAAMCDGSVHFVSNDIAIDVWQTLSTTTGGEVVANPF